MAELTPEELTQYRVDRTGWSAGPWDTEPDREQWTHAGYACLLLRHPRYGSWCGYVGVDRAHSYYGQDWRQEDWSHLEVHGGVNYSDACAGFICHVPEPGMPDEVWWIGFESAHAWDISPGLDAREKALGMPELPSRGWGWHAYRDQAYMHAEVERLAEQLRAVATA